MVLNRDTNSFPPSLCLSLVLYSSFNILTRYSFSRNSTQTFKHSRSVNYSRDSKPDPLLLLMLAARTQNNRAALDEDDVVEEALPLFA